MPSTTPPTEEFNNVLEAEVKRLKQRRSEAGQNQGNPAKDAVGLALSGGGIRSATFNLGLLQAMWRFNVLNQVDYLSTVSGGGYIGSSLTWFMSKLKKEFPFGTQRKDYKKLGGRVLTWLRAHGNYLMPGDGLGLWALISAILTGILLNLVILIPFFLFLFLVLSEKLGVSPPFFGFIEFFYKYSLSKTTTLFAWLQALGLVMIGLFLVAALVFALTTRFESFRGVLRQRWMRQRAGRMLMYGVLFTMGGSIPIIHDYLDAKMFGWIQWAMSGISFSGVISMLGALRGRKQGNEAKGLRSFFLSLGLALLVFGLFLWLYHLTDGYALKWPWLFVAIPVWYLLASIADINHVSMHRFYRNRLMAAFMPHSIEGAETDIKEADYCLLKEIPQTQAPYHIICTNIQTVGSKVARLRVRGGDSFFFSPLYCGAESTRYIKTENYIGGNMNLATAFAISGAAVDPNTYITRSRPLTFLMTLLNIRLGYWIRNPGKPALTGSLLRPMWTYYMLTEMLGSGLNEKRWNIHLSDGGHFENLGLYELLRRRCRCIIVSDATADAGWKFNDLGRCIEMARVDFGTMVSLKTEPMIPVGEDRISKQAFVFGEITYDNGDPGYLVYIKTALIDDLPEDILGYHRLNDTFPDQSTADQFFDERQFEAYRELGFQIGKKLFENADGKKLCGWIKRQKTESQKRESKEADSQKTPSQETS